MKKDLIDTIMEKEFHALSKAEREELSSYCSSEEEYNQMKEVFLGMEQMSWEHPKPKAETKKRLDDLFDSTYPAAAPVWYSSVLSVVVPKEKPMYRQPLAQIAAIALIVLLIVPFWNSNSEIVKPSGNEVVAKTKEKPAGNNNSNGGAPVAEVKKESNQVKDAASNEDSDSRGSMDKSPVLMASVEPSQNESSVGGASAESAHPDGVFIAVSQPASDSPEMFDLLTATF